MTLMALLMAAGVGPLSGQTGGNGVASDERYPASAQVDPVGQDTLRTSGEAGFRWLGYASERNRLIGGMWTLHPYAISFPRIEKTYAYGLQWAGYFASTFINSHGQRSFAAGVERDWWRWRGEDLGAGFGYRAGLLQGYDERLLDIADDIPAVPFVGILAWVRVGPYRFDSFYVYKVVTLELSLELW